MIFRCFDLETTGTDTETCEVVQAAIVSVTQYVPHTIDVHGVSFVTLPPGGVAEELTNRERKMESHSQLFAARDVPPESTRVHRITDRNPERFDFDVTVIPPNAPAFVSCVRSMVDSLTEPDVIAVSFNGCGYDIKILARFAANISGVSRETIAVKLRAKHIDVMRLWARARKLDLAPDWQWGCKDDDGGFDGPRLVSSMFSGSLTAAHGFWKGEGFGGAHDAGVDCRATLTVLDEMLRADFCTIEQAIAWSNEPLPGDVDFDGKFKWQEGRAVIGFGKHANTRLEDLPCSYLTWMLGSDFPDGTKQMLRRFLAGEYPVCNEATT